MTHSPLATYQSTTPMYSLHFTNLSSPSVYPILLDHSLQVHLWVNSITAYKWICKLLYQDLQLGMGKASKFNTQRALPLLPSVHVDGHSLNVWPSSIVAHKYISEFTQP